MPDLPLPSLTGPSRHARWRRGVARRLLAAGLVAVALLLFVDEVRPPPPPRSTVLVAARPVPAGAVLAEADLTPVEHLTSELPPGALMTTSDAVGRRVGSGLAPRELLTRSRLVPRSAADGLPPTRSAVHVVAADPAAVSLLHAGQVVSVYGPTGGRAITRAAVVLATDPEPSADAFGPGPADRGVVLAVDAAAVEALLGAQGPLGGPPVVHVVGGGGAPTAEP